ncbi:hypothetical protein ATCC90586_000003 [Pythium insidiosum]|nr:hypothetical protein ATCC90586_000003 [Pythium insidiosum]
MLPIKWTTPNDERLALTSTSIRVALFVLYERESKSGRPRTPRISFLGKSVFTPSEQDRAALAASQEVLFTLALGPETAGHVELLVRRPETQVSSPDNEEASSFCVQWTSRDALEQELQRKAQQRIERENRLVERLKAAECKATQIRELRGQALDVLRR